MYTFQQYLETVKQGEALKLDPAYFNPPRSQLAGDEFEQILDIIRKHKGLKSFESRRMYFSKSQGEALAEALKTQSGLQELVMMHGRMDTAAVEPLIDFAAESGKLHRINLSGHQDSDEIARQMEARLVAPEYYSLTFAMPATNALRTQASANYKRLAKDAHLVKQGDVAVIQPRELWRIEHQWHAIEELADGATRETLYAQLPSLPDGKIMLDDLFTGDENGFTPLDNPLTWRKHPDLLARLIMQGELDETSLSRQTPKQHTILEYAVGLGDAQTAMKTLRDNGLRLGGTWLFQNDKLIEMADILVERGAWREAFSAENWHGAPRAELNAMLKALPDNLRNQIPNRHQLLAQAGATPAGHYAARQ